MEMLERHLNDLFAAIHHCYENELLMPCLVLLCSGIDVMASLEASRGSGVGDRFENWVSRYMLKRKSLPCTAKELYAARCAVVHTFTPDSHISKIGNARVIGYVFGGADLKKLDEATVLLGRETGQVNLRIEDLIECFQNGCETYLQEALADSERRKEVMSQASIWTGSLEPEKIEAYLALKAAEAISADPTTPSK
jgi:hypothetical protein